MSKNAEEETSQKSKFQRKVMSHNIFKSYLEGEWKINHDI